MARAASTHSKPSGKRNGIREHGAQRAFSPVELLNRWEPTGAWEEYRGLAYGEGPRPRLDVYRPRHAAKAPVLVFFYGGSGNAVRAISTVLSVLRWRRKVSLRLCRIIRSSHRRGFPCLSKTPRERCALPARGHPNGAAIPRGWC